MPVIHSHCSYCGTAYTPDLAWPRLCAECGQTTWLNPLPVGLMMVPILEADGRTGLLMVRRGIEPQAGLLGFPGGFVEEGESWQQGAVRELLEETGLVADAAEVTLADVLSAPAHVILIFGAVPPRPRAEIDAITPEAVRKLSHDETLELVVIHEAQQLAFPLHTEMSNRFFASIRHESDNNPGV